MKEGKLYNLADEGFRYLVCVCISYAWVYCVGAYLIFFFFCRVIKREKIKVFSPLLRVLASLLRVGGIRCKQYFVCFGGYMAFIAGNKTAVCSLLGACSSEPSQPFVHRVPLRWRKSSRLQALLLVRSFVPSHDIVK